MGSFFLARNRGAGTASCLCWHVCLVLRARFSPGPLNYSAPFGVCNISYPTQTHTLSITSKLAPFTPYTIFSYSHEHTWITSAMPHPLFRLIRNFSFPHKHTKASACSLRQLFLTYEHLQEPNIAPTVRNTLCEFLTVRVQRQMGMQAFPLALCLRAKKEDAYSASSSIFLSLLLFITANSTAPATIPIEINCDVESAPTPPRSSERRYSTRNLPTP